MKKAFMYGIIASFFFAFTFILNRSMHLSGGSWIWSASLRYIFVFPLIAFLVWKKGNFQTIHQEIKMHLPQWFLWSIVGFGLFYAPLSFAGDYGESWLIAATWQLTIVMGIFLTPLFGKPIPVKNLIAAVIILIGVFILQISQAGEITFERIGITVFPIIIAAIAYPLGNRKVMTLCSNQISTIERIYGMTLCSLTFWLLLGAFGLVQQGSPAAGQILQSFLVALFSGIFATCFFFKATDMVKHNQKHLAIIESTQAGEVVFTLLGSVILLGDALPGSLGFIGIAMIVIGMIMNSLMQ